MRKSFVLRAVLGFIIVGQLPKLLGSTSNAAVSNHVPEERSQEPGPAWDSRPAWQRATDGAWFTLFKRRPVDHMPPPVVVPVVDRIPFRIPRAMNPLPKEMAQPVTPMTLTKPGTVIYAPCKYHAASGGNSRNAAEEKQMIAKLNQVVDVIRHNPAFPPPGNRTVVNCTFQKRNDGSNLYRGTLLFFFYPTSDRLHLWHGAVEVALNDLGLMGPRANGQDRSTDSQLVFSLPDPATYLSHPYLGAPAEQVWGGIYLSKRPRDIYQPLSYREWLDGNLATLESEYRNRQASMRPKPSVTEQVVLRNMQAQYERAVLTKQQMPVSEQDTSLWLSAEGPSDAANYTASLQVRLNTPAYFDRAKSHTSIQLINIIPVDVDYPSVGSLLQQLDFEALQQILE